MLKVKLVLKPRRAGRLLMGRRELHIEYMLNGVECFGVFRTYGEVPKGVEIITVRIVRG